MTKELIREYTLKISNASPTGIIVILYDVAIGYIEEAKNAFDSGDHEEAKVQCTNAVRVLGHLIQALDFSYGISFQLYRIYEFVSKELSMAVIKNDAASLGECKRLLLSLKDSFEEIAAKDESGPAMSNAQSVYAGLTYGKGTLNESTSFQSDNRGFQA